MKPDEESAQSIGVAGAKGVVWIGGRIVAIQVINFATIAVLARQLDIHAFGVVALANVALNLLEAIASNGVNQFIIFDREDNFQNRAKAAFWLNVLFGILAVTIGFMVAGPAARFFDEPEFQYVFQLMILRFPLEAMTRIFDAISHKELQFRNIEIRDTAIQFVSGGCSIAMALTGYGVWSIVVPMVLLSPIQVLVAAMGTRWRPGWNPGFQHWPRILRYARNIVGSSLTSLILIHGDTILVGKILGASLLGVYNLSWQVSNLVSRTIVNGGNKLFFPMLAAVGKQDGKMPNVLRGLLRTLSCITFPALVGLFVVADDFILTVYGEKWSAAVLPLRILLVYAIRYSIGSPLGPVLKALGRPDLIFRTGLFAVPFYLTAVWYGCSYGIVGVAVGVTLVRTVVGSVLFVVVARQLEVSTSSILAPVRSSILAAVSMGGVLYAIKLSLVGVLEVGGVAQLLVLVAGGVVIYLIGIRYVFRSVACDYAELATRFLGKKAIYAHYILNSK